MISNFGKTSFDTLYCVTNMPYETFRPTSLLCHSLFFIVFTTLQALVHYAVMEIYLQAIVTNGDVLLPSIYNGLLLIIIMNNFEEIKKYMFKNTSKTNIFEFLDDDIMERFRLTLFMLCIACVGISGGCVIQIEPGTFYILLWKYMHIALIIIIAEIFTGK